MAGEEVAILDAVEVDAAQARRAAIVLIATGLDWLGDPPQPAGPGLQHGAEVSLARGVAQALGLIPTTPHSPRRHDKWPDKISRRSP